MIKKLPIVFFVCILTSAGCKKAVPGADKVFIRIENATAEGFINFQIGGNEFGGIASGDTSKYLRFKNISSIPFVSPIAINNKFRNIAMDVYQDHFLPNGNYLLKMTTEIWDEPSLARFVKE